MGDDTIKSPVVENEDIEVKDSIKELQMSFCGTIIISVAKYTSGKLYPQQCIPMTMLTLLQCFPVKCIFGKYIPITKYTHYNVNLCQSNSKPILTYTHGIVTLCNCKIKAILSYVSFSIKRDNSCKKGGKLCCCANYTCFWA